jgi:superfamily II DNA or RNA helicase
VASRLRDLNLKSVYRTGKSDLLNEMYIPVLSVAKSYDRAVGYFATSLLAYGLKGISSVVKNDGKMRLIIGAAVTDEEFEALKEGTDQKQFAKALTHELEIIISQAKTGAEQHRLRLFSLLVACGNLELRFAYKKHGMYHEKMGIVEDEYGDKILFCGSANETTNAIKPDLNFESVTLYKSWEESTYKEFAQEFERGFEDLWYGRETGIVTVEMPSLLYEKISKYYRENQFEKVDLTEHEVALMEELSLIRSNNYPQVPATMGGKTFKIFDHQSAALRHWFSAESRGLFRMATGSGKTVTAMYGLSTIFNSAKSPRQMMAIIAVPYQALADQWVKELNLFNMKPVQCYRAKNEWSEKLTSSINLLISGSVEFISIVVVNKTLQSASFQHAISRVPGENIFFIGDECHHHATPKMINKLPACNYRIGLSATPFVEKDEFDADVVDINAEKEMLTSYYGNVVANYSLNEALADGVLTPYKYYIVPVYLTESEREDYKALSIEIGRLFQIDRSKANTALSNAIRKRNKVVQNCTNMHVALAKVLSEETFQSKKHTLFYVGEGAVNGEYEDEEAVSQLQSLASVISEKGWSISKFTSLESRRDRGKIMSDFTSGVIDSLVSMRVLDEGIDIPACKRAFILASSSNPRQFVQRRGRILRRYEGKEFAEIFDFIVLPCESSGEKVYEKLVRKELARVMDFVRTAQNRLDVEQDVSDLASQFKLDHREF